jgi:sulfocyanin SoxE-like protein
LSLPGRLAGVVLVTILLAACGGRTSAAEPLGHWLSFDAGRRTVRLLLVPGYNDAYGGFNFNGYGKGRVLVSVPLGWRVTVRCANVRSGLRNSCVVVRGPSDLRPAFTGAGSRRALVGLRPGAFDSFSFTAAAIGSYRLACLVAGHERGGEWDVLDVVRTARPSVVLLRRPAG